MATVAAAAAAASRRSRAALSHLAQRARALHSTSETALASLSESRRVLVPVGSACWPSPASAPIAAASASAALAPPNQALGCSSYAQAPQGQVEVGSSFVMGPRRESAQLQSAPVAPVLPMDVPTGHELAASWRNRQAASMWSLGPRSLSTAARGGPPAAEEPSSKPAEDRVGGEAAAPASDASLAADADAAAAAEAATVAESDAAAAAAAEAAAARPRRVPPYTQRRLHEVVIVGTARTAVGRFQGALSKYSAPTLGAAAILGALQRAGLDSSAVDEVIMGTVLSGGLGQAPAHQAAQAAGLPESVICSSVDKVCASGLKAIAAGAQSIALGLHSVVVAGGMESMSRAPFLLQRTANLKHAGDLPLVDSISWDGLRDASSGRSMGFLAEQCVDELRISRDDQDEEAINSYHKALAAEATGKFLHEIVLPDPHIARQLGEEHATGKRQQDKTDLLTHDEELKRFDPDKMRLMGPAFLPDGTITAGNASSLSDGAAAVVLASAEFAEKHNLPVMARILSWADADQAPERYPTSPSLAIPRALQLAGLELKDVELFEINEAFAAVTLANVGLLGLQPEQVNVHGGAVALGHPIGASGARIVVSLLTALGVQREDVGVAAICNGGGGASALVLQREPTFKVHDHHEWRETSTPS